MEFGQLIEKKIWETFLTKNHTQNVVEKPFPDPFQKTEIEQMSGWIYKPNFYTVCFSCRESWGLSKYFKTKLHIPYFYLMQSFFKIKK